MAKGKPKGHIQGRKHGDGTFTSDEYAKKHPASTTREVVPNPGHGDTGRYDDKKKTK